MIYRNILTLSSYLFFLILFFNQAYTQQTLYNHQKISSKYGGFESRLGKEDHFGRSIASIGDLDGDGIDEIAVGAPDDDDGLKNAGAIWILFLNEDAQVRASQKISMKEGGFEGNLMEDGSFGDAVTSIGDLDGDNIPDIAVGESGNNDGGENQGAVWVLFLDRDGQVKSHQKISETDGGFGGSLCKGFRFGAGLTFAGDLDKDGVGELMVSTGMNVSAAKGEIWLLFLTKEGTVKDERRITEGEGNFSGNLDAGDFFGSSLCNIGDLDGDGFAEIAVGVEGDDDGGTDNGGLYIMFFGESGDIRRTQKISKISGDFEGNLDNGDLFGGAIASVGDMDGDGIPDIAVSSYHDDDGSPDRGAVWVLSMTEEGTVKTYHKISQTTGNFKGELAPKYEWGMSIAGLKDFNNDGLLEIAVSGHNDGDGGVEKGAVWILYPEEKELLPSSLADNLIPKATPVSDQPDSLLTSLDYDLTGTPENHILFLLDVSASMKRSDRLPLLRDSFLRLLNYMRPVDKISVITYSGAPKVVLEAVPAIYKDSIAHSIENLISKGSTKTFKALKEAYKLSNNHFLPSGNNRIILATDGGFEIRELFKLTEKYASRDLPVSVFYFGKQPQHRKELLEELAQSAYGNCAHILPQKVDGALLRELKGNGNPVGIQPQD